jgi:drug/metabolite transporter (DMT)-like permease
LQLDSEFSTGVIFALAATVLWGVTNVAYKKASDRFDTATVVSSRLWISVPLAYAFAVVSVGSFVITVPLESFFPLAISMLIGILLGDSLYFLSQDRIGVSRAFPIAMSYPLVVYAIAATYLAEPVLPQRIIGALLVVIGVGLVAQTARSDSETDWEFDEKHEKIGLVLAIGTAAAWGFGDVVFQIGLTGVEVPEANFVRLLIAALAVIPFYLKFKKNRTEKSERKYSILLLVAGFFGMGVSLICYSFAIKLVGATVTSIVVAAAPVLTTPLSVLYLSENPSRATVVGTVLAIIGEVLVVFAI